LVFPLAARPIAVEYPGYPVMRLRRIEGLEFVKETIAALGVSTELAGHLFRECWSVGTGSGPYLCQEFGWDVDVHRAKVAMAADMVALWHNGRITVDGGQKEVSAAVCMPDPSRPPKKTERSITGQCHWASRYGPCQARPRSATAFAIRVPRRSPQESAYGLFDSLRGRQPDGAALIAFDPILG
jgi:hypothetical protein